MNHYQTFERIQAERNRQLKKWGRPELSNEDRLMILTEELGEVAKECHDLKFADQFPEHCNGSHENLKAELIQVAAVCFAWLEEI